MANKKKNKRNPRIKLTEEEILAKEKKLKQARQKQAIIVFTSGILLLAVQFIPGKGLWLWLKSLLFGMFGLSAVLLPIALIYISVMIAFDKLEGNSKDKIWQMVIFILLICGLSEVLATDPYAGANFWEKIQILYKGGLTYTTGGVFSTIIGWPLLLLCGKTGAVIIMLLFLFAFFMILTNSSLAGLFTGVKKSAKKVGGIYSSAKKERIVKEQAEYEMLASQEEYVQEDYSQEYNDDYSIIQTQTLNFEETAEIEYVQQKRFEQDYSESLDNVTRDMDNDLLKEFNKIHSEQTQHAPTPPPSPAPQEPKQAPPVYTTPMQEPVYATKTQEGRAKPPIRENPFKQQPNASTQEQLLNQYQAQAQAQAQQPQQPPFPTTGYTNPNPRRTVEELLELERERTARNSRSSIKYDDYAIDYTENNAKSARNIEVLVEVENEEADEEFEQIVKDSQLDEIEQSINFVNNRVEEPEQVEEIPEPVAQEVQEEPEVPKPPKAPRSPYLINDIYDEEEQQLKEQQLKEELEVEIVEVEVVVEPPKVDNYATIKNISVVVEEEPEVEIIEEIVEEVPIKEEPKVFVGEIVEELEIPSFKPPKKKRQDTVREVVDEPVIMNNGFRDFSSDFEKDMRELTEELDVPSFMKNRNAPQPAPAPMQTPTQEPAPTPAPMPASAPAKTTVIPEEPKPKPQPQEPPVTKVKEEPTTIPSFDSLKDFSNDFNDILEKKVEVTPTPTPTPVKSQAPIDDIPATIITKRVDDGEDEIIVGKVQEDVIKDKVEVVEIVEEVEEKLEVVEEKIDVQEETPAPTPVQAPIPTPTPAPNPTRPRYTSSVAETVNDDYSTKILAKQEENAVDRRVAEFEAESKKPHYIPPQPTTQPTKTENVEEPKKANAYENYMYYDYPPTSLLKPAPVSSNVDTHEELKQIGELLIDTLASFKVQASMLDINRGPSVTRYELKPATGVKLSKIVGLGDDIALNLSASGVRVAPIPGKPAIGIEVPNQTTDIVTMREIIESDDFDSAESNVSIALGKDITGNNIIGDIATMPHMLIAGSTGAGKSVCINSIIMSILYKSSPEDVRLLMIDPKVVELGIYNGIPHLLVPVVTDPRKAAGALAWAVKEMLKRYEMFAENNVRDIKGYNALSGDDVTHMPQIVIIIDELSDLMMAASKEVEDSICRLAQMARAAGMHLIIATQRPSVDVITGLIKANVPSRIAFAVSSQIDSRTILDSPGAEKLLGRGDMLFAPVGASKPLRVQGCFVSDDEINKVVGFIKAEGVAEYDEQILQEIENQALQEKGGKADKSAGGGFDDTDELLYEAIELVIDAEKASTSFLQRKLRIGYARAAKIIDEMEERNFVAPQDGSKPRQVLISKQQWYELKMKSQ